MSDQREFSDEQLTAYLDGETDHIPATEIESALENDAALRARLESLSVDTQEIAEALDGLLAHAPAAPDLPEGTDAGTVGTRGPVYRAIAASAVVCLALGGILGFLLSPPQNQTWRDYVATYQALYINATLAHIDQPNTNLADELKRVSQAIGKDIELSSVEGRGQLDYKRAQILGFNGRPLIQLAFLSKVGTPIALCIIRSQTNAARDVSMSEREGMSSASWAKGGYEYMLIGGGDDMLISQAAKEFVDAL